MACLSLSSQDTSAAQLSCHLAEFICREFARCTPLQLVVARLGHLDDPTQRYWVDSAAVRLALLPLVVGAEPPAPDKPGAGRETAQDHAGYNILHLQDATCDAGPLDDADEPYPTDGEILALIDGETDAGVQGGGAVEGGEHSRVLLMGCNGMMGQFVSAALTESGRSVDRVDSNPPAWNLNMPW